MIDKTWVLNTLSEKLMDIDYLFGKLRMELYEKNDIPVLEGIRKLYPNIDEDDLQNLCDSQGELYNNGIRLGWNMCKEVVRKLVEREE